MAEDKKKPKIESVREPKDGEKPVVDSVTQPDTSVSPTVDVPHVKTTDNTPPAPKVDVPPAQPTDAKMVMDTKTPPPSAVQAARDVWGVQVGGNENDPVALLREMRDILRDMRDRSEQQGGVTLG